MQTRVLAGVAVGVFCVALGTGLLVGIGGAGSSGSGIVDHVHGSQREGDVGHTHAEGEGTPIPERPDVPEGLVPVLDDDGALVVSADGSTEAWIDKNAAEASTEMWLAGGGEPELNPIPDWEGDPRWWFLPPQSHPADPRWWVMLSPST